MSPSQNPRISLPNMAVPVVRVALSQMQRTYFFHEIIYVFFCVCLNREAQPRGFVFDDLCQFLETNSWSLKTEFLEIWNFRSRATGPCMSRREIKIDVWKYNRDMVIDPYAFLEQKLAHLHCLRTKAKVADQSPRRAKCPGEHSPKGGRGHPGMASP
mmetsp:Transcript_95190/g.139016  ORF Transcript_95190/g.139016 Transcript_95190/m.139016 type:complete len:157 (+) Transcript_95190:140-610(+)